MYFHKYHTFTLLNVPAPERFDLLQDTEVLGPALVDGQQQQMQVTGPLSFVQ